jgi:serine/threonine-protein kinase RsbW
MKEVARMPNPLPDACIKLTFPMNAAYVSSARLTASAVANRVNFDIDEIEDIKMAVSEACTYVLKTMTGTENSNFDIQFQLSENQMEITLVIRDARPVRNSNDEMSLMMIKALVDDFDMSAEDDVTIKMIKLHTDSSLKY